MAGGELTKLAMRAIEAMRHAEESERRFLAADKEQKEAVLARGAAIRELKVTANRLDAAVRLLAGAPAETLVIVTSATTALVVLTSGAVVEARILE